jgi:hypothetical protein
MYNQARKRQLIYVPRERCNVLYSPSPFQIRVARGFPSRMRKHSRAAGFTRTTIITQQSMSVWRYCSVCWTQLIVGRATKLLPSSPCRHSIRHPLLPEHKTWFVETCVIKHSLITDTIFVIAADTPSCVAASYGRSSPFELTRIRKKVISPHSESRSSRLLRSCVAWKVIAV